MAVLQVLHSSLEYKEMTQVQSGREDRSLSATTTPTPTTSSSSPAVLGSYHDYSSYALTAAVNAAYSDTSNAHSLPDGEDPSSSSPTSSSPRSSPSSVPKLLSVATIQSATGAAGSWRVNGACKSVAEELQHPGEMSGENSVTESNGVGSSSDGSSLARVDLREIGDESHNFTTNTLRRCKLQVLKPYWGLLMFVGWRVFRHDVITPRSWRLRALNILYPAFIIILLFYTYMYEMVACEWKLDVTKDIEIRTSPKPTTVHHHNHTTNGTADQTAFTLAPAWMISTTPTTPAPPPSPKPCEHIVTTYLIPNVLHFVAYVMGMYYFRIQDNEQMYALMEKVFLQANPLHTSSSSQQKLVCKTRLFLVFGSLWVLATLGLQGLYVWAFDFPGLAIFEEFGMAFHWVTFSIELVGRVVFNSVILAVIINYATQCEMVMFYVKGLSLRLQEKSADIKTAFKDTWLLRQNLSLLNGVISKMTSLTLVILAELTVIGISILVLNRYNLAIVWVYRGLFPVVWGIMLCFPLFQAARVNYVCQRIKKTSLEMRVFGYKNSSQLELDSFLQFVHATQLRAKLFHVPIQPSVVMSVCILGAFVFLLLVQTSSLVPQNDII